MSKKPMQTLAILACALLPAAAASADTSYTDFAEMDIDSRILVIREEMHIRLREAEQDAPLKAACIVELFSPQGDGQLSLGYRTAIDVVEFGAAQYVTDDDDQTVEEAVTQMIELFCPI
ncbi:hypothetical protein SAMN05216196_1222 [Lutimaribacter pacificus]|uniref:HdeA/HdeB family protein n=1 Tax=Lutimaribacter pacificus TaxID=391948 RepID=A0A1H0PD94_9RHOB|nr:hypothetical protein [Lutimaribacter pacificus]SDP03062.1 hypothetical protein SAMN05216196_1222 [Lutimaribacter pacificus]SHL04298.1 hypothetical protein SAMN05444142_1212 [Lutimaribacter pacificus]